MPEIPQNIADFVAQKRRILRDQFLENCGAVVAMQIVFLLFYAGLGLFIGYLKWGGK